MKQYRLNHSQMRIYLEEKKNPGTSLWNVPYALRINKEIDIEKMKKILLKLISVNEIFKCKIIEKDDGIWQVINNQTKEMVEFYDFSEMGEEKKWKLWAGNEAKKPIDMLGDKLYRITLVKINDKSFAIMFVAHHIIVDGSAAALFIQKTVEAYENKREYKEEVISYNNYSDEEEEYIHTEDFKQDKKYWEEILADLPEPAEMIFSVKKENMSIDRMEFEFQKELNDRIYDYCRVKHLSPYRFFLTCLSVISLKIKGMNNMVFGTVSSNRSAINKDIIGDFISVEPLLIDLDSKKSFNENAMIIGKKVKEMIHHSRYPYEEIIKSLRKVYHEVPDLLETTVVGLLEPELPKGYEIEFYCHGMSLNSMVFFISYSKDSSRKKSMRILIDYRKSNFKREEIIQLWSQIERIAELSIEDSKKSLEDLSIISNEEEARVLNEFNRNKKFFPNKSSINQVFEEQCLLNSGNLAVKHGEKEYNYEELNRMANQLAWILKEKGVEKGSIVGIYLDQSPEMIISLLAVLKAGAAYMPIDIKYPLERVKFMIDDSQAKIVITRTIFLRNIGKSSELINLDSKEIFTGNCKDLGEYTEKGDAACVIYTSGSTGKPKGVVLEHGSMINFSYWFVQFCNMRSEDHVSKHASFSFDASILEIFPALFSGASLYIIPEEIRLSLNDINEYFEDNGITIAFFTTQFAEQYMDLIDNQSLRFLITGGEKLRNYKKRAYQLLNLYGPTEATVCVTAHLVEKQEDNIPIGKPISNSFIYILDKKGKIVPIGVPGELCIGGIPLARGYLNRDDLNKEKFVYYSYLQEKRIYKTGDLARWLPDGNIEHLGRIDRQVKIRGFRIEPEEIEKEILKNNNIMEAAVHPYTDGNGRLSLCGYYRSVDEIDEETVKRELQKKLPSYMIPSIFMRLDKMPLTASGKIDRKRLPKLEDESQKEIIIAPENEIQEKIIHIWKRILKIEKIGVEHHFFHLGGHSLNAISILASIEKETGIRLTLKEFMSHPTVKELSKVCENKVVKKDIIEKAPALEYYPVSPNQLQLYMLEQMGNIGTVYHVTVKIELGNSIDIKKLGDSIDKLIEKHSVFRTSFIMDKGVLKQKLEKTIKMKRNIIESSKENLDSVIKSFIKPFHLNKAPLLRIMLVKIENGNYILLLDTHHIIFDGISYGIFISDLKKLYYGLDTETKRFDFYDYTYWYNQEIEKGIYESQRNYWSSMLQSIPTLDLPTDNRRTSEIRFEGNRITQIIDKTLVQEIKKNCIKNSVTMHSFLMAAVCVLLSKYTNQEDIIIGTPMAGRFREDFFQTIGMFVNTLPVRCFPEKEKTFRQFVKEISGEMLEVTENQEYPIDLLYRLVKTHQEAGRNPLFDVIFVMENIEYPDFSKEDSFQSAELIYDETAKFDLNFTVEEIKEQLFFHIEYRKNLFHKSTIERMLKHFLQILNNILNNMEMTISQVNILSAREETDLLYLYNRTSAEWPQNVAIQTLFEEQADTYPHRIAVEFGNKKITYKELDKKSNQIARILKQDGIGPDKIVGIFLHRSIEMIIAALGVLKAGGAYLPVIPDYPSERIQYIFKDSGTEIILTSSELLERLDYTGKTYCLDNQEIFQEDDTRLEIKNSIHDMAYVIYTSGSTGKPKGVMVEHGNVIRLMRNDRFYFDFTENDVWTLFHSFSFDFSVWEMYGALLFGGKLIIVPKEAAQNPDSFRELLIEKKVTILNQTPGAFYNLIDAEEKKGKKELNLRMVIFGGEALKPLLLRPFHDKYPEVKLINMYGITETTVHVTYKEITDIEIENNISNIGLPIPTLSTYVLNEQGQLVPYGVAGELCVGGDGVTRGYLNKKELTEQRFIENPYIPGERIYRSGDLVKRMANGEIVYLGRIDFQVQLHGFRVELGEIENEILKISDIEKTVVLAKEDKNNIQYLCAYYISSKELSVKEFREHLGKTLPEYMIPSYFIRLESMPLTSNGKIDRRALPEPGKEIHTGAEYEAAKNKKQETIIQIWEEILGLKRIGIYDNFFALGGHSLKAVALVSKLQEYFEVSVNDIFQYPTISELSEKVKELEGGIIGKLIQLRDSFRKIKKQDFSGLQGELEKYYQKIKEFSGMDLLKTKEYQHILLTGATGYLGSYLLRGLLKRGYSVSVIIRGETKEQCKDRLSYVLKNYFDKEAEEMVTKIDIYPGDLEKDFLGLSRNDYQELSEKTDCIIHSAANVRHFGNYDEFYSANVTSVLNLIDFCESGNDKDFNHISTCSVAYGLIKDKKEVLFTEFDCDMGQECDNVYVKSKFTAEKEIVKYYSRGGTGKIFRLGNIAFDSVNGKFQRNIQDNAFFQQVNSYVNLGYAPDKTDERDVSFVDQCAEAVLTLFNREAFSSMNFHIENPYRIKLSELLKDSQLDLMIERVSAEDFIDYLILNYNRPFFKEYIDNVMLHMGWLDEEENVTEFHFCTDLTNYLLEQMNFQWIKPQASHFNKMIDRAFKERLEAVSLADLLNGLSNELLMSIVKNSKLEYYDDGEDIFWEGEENPNLYLILDGNAAVDKKSPHGWSGTISIVGNGEFIGEENIGLGNISPVTVEAVLGDVVVFKFPSKKWKDYLQRYPELSEKMIVRLNRKINQLRNMIISLG